MEWDFSGPTGAYELQKVLKRRYVKLRVKDGKLKARGPHGAITPELREAIAKHKTALVAIIESWANRDKAWREIWDQIDAWDHEYMSTIYTAKRGLR